MNYYNEWDSGAAAWLRELINQKLIPNGYVDERSITEVTPSDLEGFTQCHFFAGIGGWPLALQLAGVPESTRLWTGSPPCQPFSVAGQSLGFDDERHLAPAFLRLIRECKPELLFGEQVAAAIGKHWLDFVFLNLEEKGYTCGAAVLPACSVGAPHKRERIYFGAGLLVHPDNESISAAGHYARVTDSVRSGATSGGVADANDYRQQPGARSGRGGECSRPGNDVGRCSSVGRVAYADDERLEGRLRMPERPDELVAGEGSVAGGPANPHQGFWSDADWLGCRDGKFRPVRPGTFPLANGIPARVGRLRGYGNAIVPQVAAEFVKAFFYSIEG